MTAQPDTHLLIVDDDERIRSLLQKFLIRNGFWVTTARDAAHARRILAGLDFDLIVMDVMMPGEDGISLTRELRAKMATPILLLTARGETSDRIAGLEAGADDYLAKPFEPRELLLRINAILRRTPAKVEPKLPKVLAMGEVRYDVDRGEMWRGSNLIRLTATEAALMRIFAARPGEPVSRTSLVEDLNRGGGRGDTGQTQERAVDVQITRLRRKFETDPKQPRYLQTVRGAGYMLAPD
ncbi:MAG: response regulator [Rhodobacteraceae bacterium]|jgi:two-component system phosphate regulon response regulator OmpR|uniref:response regulator n=1 Tax=Albidovulum sp. TaxID=1872424 RepID=UPI001DC4F7E7|nr:response regulator [uncultured Defluviimonas sp.]MCB2125559.1 response regulator [Paracoccaceae bacterium]MCC0070748.1 response regulator [Paracoccaceae bacterium]